MTNNVAITITSGGVSTGLINLQDYSKVIVKKTKSDIEPFKVLKYNNEDGGNSFVYTITDKQVNSASFLLKNERDEFITDCPDHLMVVQYIIYEKEDHTIKNSLLSC